MFSIAKMEQILLPANFYCTLSLEEFWCITLFLSNCSHDFWKLYLSMSAQAFNDAISTGFNF